MGYKDKPRDYFKNSDFKEGDKIKFVADGEWVEQDFSLARDGSGMKTVFKAKVSLNDGEPKDLNVNSTSGNVLSESWDEEGWTGKTAKVTFVKALVAGKMCNALALVPEK